VLKTAILTISDKGAKGERADESGAAIRDMLEVLPASVIAYEVVPDERALISGRLIHFADALGAELIITTGGTGVSPRDVTPEATRDVLDRELPGMAEAMRASSLKHTPHSMLSRAVCGIRGGTLIINLPGSPKAVRENFAVVLPAIQHAVEKICGSEAECGR
jgi:molybdopterin adenylyltransferase